MDARASSNELFNLTRKKKFCFKLLDVIPAKGGGGEKGTGGGGEESLTDSTEGRLTVEQYPQNRHIHL